MSKIAVLGAIAATGIVATAVPAALLSGKSSSTKKQLIPQLTAASDITKEDKYKEVDCLKNYFGEIEFKGTSTSSSKPLKTDQIQNFSSTSKSCLLVEYYKKTYKENKWHGEFRFIWAIKDNNQGLITVTSSRTEKGSLKGSSAAYTLKKNENNNSWSTSYKYEVGERGKNDSSLKNLIPQATSTLPGHPDTEKYWGFDPDVNNMCKEENKCTENEINTIEKSYSWELIGTGQGSEVSSWTDNMSNWLDVIYKWKVVMEKIKEIKGNWTTKTHW